ncbi:hypothetical protein ANME2D_02329 [Candidatus Methanoperedens nitroreducens]|uniref:Uncharacterized protein n=1 Tax=Candidatus Methanoperedens nitratireducens TaxID=1392998 RepID=A0A062V740_9EURY|nr:hypothetical protein [Candidatus Methanoperedens nitroreducens]KCZ71594.1 hypothetical protein ANME2D_02329 [Candidatus Methanoperedens nitroreducens]MDJ1421224.1 hypothetical protein [Candidatus Methanoperedens sp.]
MNDHDLLIRLDQKMDSVLISLEEGKKQFRDISKRLNEEEKCTVRFKTGIGIISFIILVVMTRVF